jgi:hypothetical protein
VVRAADKAEVSVADRRAALVGQPPSNPYGWYADQPQAAKPSTPTLAKLERQYEAGPPAPVRQQRLDPARAAGATTTATAAATAAAAASAAVPAPPGPLQLPSGSRLWGPGPGPSQPAVEAALGGGHGLPSALLGPLRPSAAPAAAAHAAPEPPPSHLPLPLRGLGPGAGAGTGLPLPPLPPSPPGASASQRASAGGGGGAPHRSAASGSGHGGSGGGPEVSASLPALPLRSLSHQGREEPHTAPPDAAVHKGGEAAALEPPLALVPVPGHAPNAKAGSNRALLVGLRASVPGWAGAGARGTPTFAERRGKASGGGKAGGGGAAAARKAAWGDGGGPKDAPGGGKAASLAGAAGHLGEMPDIVTLLGTTGPLVIPTGPVRLRKIDY